VQPYMVTEVQDNSGKVLYRRQPPPPQRVVAAHVNRDMVAMLYGVVTEGTGRSASLTGHEAAGKTGTTQDYRDAWFVGFTSDYVSSVWVGNDDNKPMRKVTGGLVPALLWKNLMQAAEAGQPARPLDRTPEPADVSPDFAAEQVANVDEVRDINSAAPQVPVDDKGDFVAGNSGVSPGRPAQDRVAHNDDGY